MKNFDLRNRCFRGIVNYDDGDANQDTIFQYDQVGDIVTATYEGGRVRHGQILGRVTDDKHLDMVWQYLNIDGQFIAGICTSTPELLADGRYRLNESWTITSGPDAGVSGVSAIEEIR